MLWFKFVLGLMFFFKLVSVLFAIVPHYGNEYTTKENKKYTSLKKFAPKLNLNHNIDTLLMQMQWNNREIDGIAHFIKKKQQKNNNKKHINKKLHCPASSNLPALLAIRAENCHLGEWHSDCTCPDTFSPVKHHPHSVKCARFLKLSEQSTVTFGLY